MTVIKCKQPEIRAISQGAFFERFTVEERILIRNSEDVYVIDLIEQLKSR